MLFCFKPLVMHDCHMAPTLQKVKVGSSFDFIDLRQKVRMVELFAGCGCNH